MSNRLRKALVLVICCLFVLALVASFTLAAVHVRHCCHPLTCLVCHQIDAMRSLLKQLALAMAALVSWLLMLARPRMERYEATHPRRFPTPVSLFVRMNN